MAMLQKRLKQEMISVINELFNTRSEFVYYRVCDQAYFFFHLISMRNRPLINESCLQKISGKAQHFMIRNKLSLSKGPRPPRNTANIDSSELNIHQEVLICAQIIQKWLEDGQSLSKEDGTRVLRVMREVKSRWGQMEYSAVQDEFEQNNSAVLRSMNKSRGRVETGEDIRESNSGDRTDNVELVLTKSKSKENANRNPVLWEMRLERLQTKLEQTEMKAKEYETKIKVMMQQIANMNAKQLEIEQQLKIAHKQKKELGSKASALVLQKIEVESNLKFQLIELQQKVEDSKTMRKVLEDRLAERQREMVSIYQSSLL